MFSVDSARVFSIRFDACGVRDHPLDVGLKSVPRCLEGTKHYVACMGRYGSTLKENRKKSDEIISAEWLGKWDNKI